MSITEQDAQGGDQKLETEDVSAPPKPAPGTVPMAQRGALYTMTAREGVNAAELVNAALAKKTVGKQSPRRVEVAAPDGPSTDGGKRARQTIKLVPVSGSGGPVMCGALDAGQKTVELRSYRTVAQQFKERFGMSLDFTADEYAALLKDLETTLGIFKYTVTHEPAPAAGGAASATATAQSAVKPKRAEIAAKDDEEESGSSALNIVLIAAAVIALGGVAIAIFMR